MVNIVDGTVIIFVPISVIDAGELIENEAINAFTAY